MARVVVAGVAGCIGSWVAKTLLGQGHEVIGLDLQRELPLARLLGLEAVRLETLDVCEGERFAQRVRELRPDAIVHLVSLLMPACRERPGRCVEVNVQSFMSALEAAREVGATVAYASSAWVLRPFAGDAPVGEADAVEPQSLYGVFKLANEGMARIYARDFGVRVNGLRPYIVYGPGRTSGLTADINLALLAASRGERYEIGFGGSVALHHVADVAELFVRLALAPAAAGRVYNVRGSVCTMDEVVAAIESTTGTSGLVRYRDEPLPIAANLDDAALQRDYGPLAFMDLEAGMLATLALQESVSRSTGRA
jgi:nucleoside-diphosphate-sugar epimerase